MRNGMVRVVSGMVLFVFMAVGLQAAPITWLGTNSGDWSDPANWDLGRIPAGGDAIILPAAAPNKTQTVFTVGSSTSQITLDIQGGGYTLNNALARLTFGTILNSVGNNVINCGIWHQNNPAYTPTGGTLTFAGPHSTKGLNLQGSGDFIFLSNVLVGGNRTLNFSGTGTARVQADLGAFKYYSGTQAGGVEMNAAGTLLVNGTQSVGTLAYGIGSNGTLGGYGSAEVTYNALYTGSGIIGIGYRPSTLHATGNGTLAPGDPLVDDGLGTFTVTVGDSIVFGSDAVSTTGTLAIQLGAAGTSDRLVVNGDLDLSSSFDVLSLSVADGIALSEDYSIFTFTGTRTGMFDTVLLNGDPIYTGTPFVAGGGRFRLVYDGDANGLISLIAVPEPASFALVCMMAAGVLFRRRRFGHQIPGLVV